MQQDTVHDVDFTTVRGIEDLLSRPSIPVGRQLIDQTLNRKRIKEVADKISNAVMYLLTTEKIKREETTDGIPKFWLSKREQPTDHEGRVIRLVTGTSRPFRYRLMNGTTVMETNVTGVGDEVGKRLPPTVKTMMPVPQDKATQDQLAAVMLQNGSPEQVKQALVYAGAPALAEEMRQAAAEVEAESEAEDEEDEWHEPVDGDTVIDDTPPAVLDGTSNFMHARMKDLDGFRLDDQLVIAVGFWHNPVKEDALLEFMAKYGVTKQGTIKLRLAHVVKVRQELTRIERDDGVYYKVGPKQMALKQRPKTASYKPKAPSPQMRTVELPVPPAAGTTVHVTTNTPPVAEVRDTAFMKKAIELNGDSKVQYLVDSEGTMNINVSGVNVLSFTPEAAAKLVHFASSVKGLYDL